MSKLLAAPNAMRWRRTLGFSMIAQSELALYFYRDLEDVAGNGVARNTDDGGRAPYGKRPISI